MTDVAPQFVFECDVSSYPPLTSIQINTTSDKMTAAHTTSEVTQILVPGPLITAECHY